MKLGFTLPPPHPESHRELPRLIKCIESAGYDHVVVLDHVLGAEISHRPDWLGPYSLNDPFYEPMTVLSYIAAISCLELVTGVLVLPQRQTALVAKQAAELQVLSEGRLRLGVGIGWNEVEYDALGMDFRARAGRLSEQVGLLRQLWSQDSVTFSGRHDRVDAAGINLRPANPPPIWMGGGHHLAAARRIGELADGWMVPAVGPGRGFEPMRDQILQARRDAGLDADSFPMEGGVLLTEATGAAHASRAADRWLAAGVSHIQVMTGKRPQPTEITMQLAVVAAEAIRSG